MSDANTTASSSTNPNPNPNLNSPPLFTKPIPSMTPAQRTTAQELTLHILHADADRLRPHVLAARTINHPTCLPAHAWRRLLDYAREQGERDCVRASANAGCINEACWTLHAEHEERYADILDGVAEWRRVREGVYEAAAAAYDESGVGAAEGGTPVEVETQRVVSEVLAKAVVNIVKVVRKVWDLLGQQVEMAGEAGTQLEKVRGGDGMEEGGKAGDESEVARREYGQPDLMEE